MHNYLIRIHVFITFFHHIAAGNYNGTITNKEENKLLQTPRNKTSTFAGLNLKIMEFFHLAKSKILIQPIKTMN